MTKFQRPADLEFPLVYRTFKAPDSENRDIVEYRVQDLLESDYEHAADLMVSDFVNEESLALCRGVYKDENAVAEIRKIWRAVLNENISLGCYDNKNKLVGLTILAVHEKNFEESVIEFETDEVNDVISALYFIETQHDIFAKYNTDKYLTDYGMVTSHNYRQRGVATEILKARIVLMKNLNIKVTAGAFTVIGSQRAAIKANYIEGFSIKWTEVEKKFPAFDFSIANVDCCKIMEFAI
ncbi:hypothetical protein PVAND_013684 [Polypedilum vanderplanki]|uniref:N-acetyltransferase domain-containing protein n=1 Tax=Polypedilum vanderplanki TaxID=319348 RepID=A0A9J6CQ54_POLVA|nr:hypothetical protein PVAND_013684 [Polypedilum vanderplanki]